MGAAVGGSRPEVGAVTSQPGNDTLRSEEPPNEVYNILVASEWVPAKEPVAERTIPTIYSKCLIIILNIRLKQKIQNDVMLTRIDMTQGHNEQRIIC